MSTNQPVWKVVGNVGDINPIEYGGGIVFEDTTGVYEPEMHCFNNNEEHEGTDKEVELSVVLLEKCYFNRITNTLSDNKYHKDHAAWFAKDISKIVECYGIESKQLIEWLCSDDTMERAMGYETLVNYYGKYEFDQDPTEISAEKAKLSWQYIAYEEFRKKNN